jgi:hypothetical protein
VVSRFNPNIYLPRLNLAAPLSARENAKTEGYEEAFNPRQTRLGDLDLSSTAELVPNQSDAAPAYHDPYSTHRFGASEHDLARPPRFTSHEEPPPGDWEDDTTYPPEKTVTHSFP